MIFQMEGGCGGGGGGRERLSPLDRLSADENSRGSVGNMTLESILSSGKRSTPVNRTLLDIIRDEEPNGSLFGHKDKKSWKAFRDRLRLKRAGAAWTSSVHIPTSDIPLPREGNSNSNSNNRSTNNSSRSLMSRRNSVRFTTVSSVRSPESEESDDNLGTVPSSRPQISRRVSTRYGSTPAESTQSDYSDVNIHSVEEAPPSRSFRQQISRHNSTRYPAHDSTHSEENDVEPAARDVTRRLAVVLAEERQLSAREAVAAQEAAEAAAQAEAAAAAAAEDADEDASPGSAEAETEAQQPAVRMSLMDLLEETDRQMGFVGSRYTMGDYVEGEEEEEEEVDDGGETGGVEHTCCVCMVRHKGAAFIPCGHTFCRLCSRELWVQRGNCPLCNGFILEILDIF